MIDPRNMEVFSLPLGGSTDPEAQWLEEVRSMLERHMTALGEIAASLQTVERLPELLEAVQAFLPVVQARTHAQAAAQALRKLLEP